MASQKDISISVGKAGMNKDTHISNLKEMEYRHAKNSNFSEELGEGFNIQNEHSNILASKFKDGFKVVGYVTNVNLNETYFFLTNPKTNQSEIGRIKNENNLPNLQDNIVDCDDCDQAISENPSLEDLIQIESQIYETVVSDCKDNFCLNFNIDFPIKTALIKDEKCGKILYWTDNLNPPRYLELDKLDQYLFEGEENCGEGNLTPTCLDCNKLNIFKEAVIPILETSEIVLGGNLKRGSYQAVVAYCDELGNEQSRYFTVTEPAFIYDEQNNILQQPQLGDETNYALKINVKNLDTRFSHYKVVIIQNTDINRATSYFVEGIHNTSDNIILYTTDANKERTFLDRLVQFAVRVDKLEKLTTANNYLLGKGITYKKRKNLQKVVNLIGEFVQWQSHVATENLYKDGVKASKYRQFMRDETYPLAIRFIEDSDYSPTFPLIGRQMEVGEDEIINNTDKDSINKQGTNCSSEEINKRWQLYNTAEEIGRFDQGDLPTTIVTTTEQVSCFVGDAENPIGEIQNTDINYEAITIDLEESQTFVNLEYYIEQNIDRILSTENADLTDGEILIKNLFTLSNYTGQNCIPEIDECLVTEIVLEGDSGTANINVEGTNYLITYNTDLPTTVSDFIFTHETALNNEGIEVSSDEGVLILTSTSVLTVSITTIIESLNGEILQNNCCTLSETFTNEEIEIVDILGETSTFNPEVFPDNYPSIPPPNFCNLIDDSRRYYTNTGTVNAVLNAQGFSGRNTLTWLRTDSPFETSPSFSDVITLSQNLQNNTTSHFVNYFFALEEEEPAYTYANLLTTRDAIPSGASTLTSVWNNSFTYPDKIFKNAKWFKLEDLSDSFVFYMSRDSNQALDFFSTKEYRITIYNSDLSTPIHSFLKSIAETLILKFTKTGNDLEITNQNGDSVVILGEADSLYYIAIDTPAAGSLSPDNLDEDAEALYLEGEVVNPSPPPATVPGAVPPECMNFSSAGCFSVALINEINQSVTVDYDSIKVRKRQDYNLTCKYEEPIIDDDCEALPFAFGKMGYVESTEEYPNNKELYDSSDLEITPEDIPDDIFYEQISFRDFFEEKFTTGTNEGRYILKDSLDLSCNTPIRHFKFPDNKVSSHIYDRTLSKFSDSLVYPLGLKLDGKIVDAALNIAVKNNLITQKEKDEIQGFELLRGDRSVEKSIIAKGITFDLYDYQKNNRTLSYANYPLNSLGDDIMHYQENNTTLIPHPENSQRNYRWTFTSPETDYNRINIPSLMKVEGYQYGSTLGNFDLVEDHPKWTILGRTLRRTASQLALLEVVAEAVISAAQAFANTKIDGGTSTTVFHGAPFASVTIGLFNTITSAVFKYGRYKYQWLETFRNLGKRRNFAAYYTTVGKYNFIYSDIQEGDSLRYLNIRSNIKGGRNILTDRIEGERLELNHIDREKTVLLSTGKSYKVDYPAQYQNYDNASTSLSNSSRTYASISRVCDKGMSADVEKRTASMYVSLKEYLPSQYGTINSVRWIPISKRGNLNQDNLFFGGDTFICRHTLRRPFPFFLATAFNQADDTAYEYKFYTNIGDNPRFYCNYKLDDDRREGGQLLPENNSEFNFDCPTNINGSYVKEPSKFYLYYNGIPSFLTESVINTNFRHAESEPWSNFYPNEPDYMWWTQQKNNPIRRGNKFLYNQNYSLQTTPTGVLTFPDNYNQEEYDCRTDAPNGVISSLPDNSENNFVDPWLIFRPNDKYEFPTKYGKLNGIKGIESEQVLAVFDNTTAIFNAVDQLVDEGSRPETREVGLGGIFARRPRVFTETELGYAGSQHFPILSCEFGHFIVDSERGHIFRIAPGGKDLEEISSRSGDQPSGMRNWFKENLPFKVKQTFPDTDIDNPYNGYGIIMGYDSRYKRIFITKKDVVVIDKKDTLTKSTTKDASWTISYDLQTGKWASFFDFKPNYYINQNNYFQTGINSDDNENGLWSHLLTNKSFQVFYGKKYNWEIEIPIHNKGANQALGSISYMLDSRKYFNEYDYIQNKEIGFDNAYIYNNSNLSGRLKLVLQKTLRDLSKYPKTVGNTQQILQSQQDGIMSFNYFYNRVKKEFSGIPLFKNDVNGVDKEINPTAVSFFGKRSLERLRGDSFIVNLSSSETKHKKIFKLAKFNKTIYTN